MQPSDNPSSDQSQKAGGNKPPGFSQLSTEQFKARMEQLVGEIRRKAIITNQPVPKIEVIQQGNDFLLQVTDPRTKEIILIKAEQSIEENHRLADEATRLNKAWLMALAILGIEAFEKLGHITIPREGLLVMSYDFLDDKSLHQQVEQLKIMFEFTASLLLLEWKSESLLPTTVWLAGKYDECSQAAPNVYCIGRLYEVEERIGFLSIRRHGDYPPYAQVIVQGFIGAGFRHPEYHLASDLALLYNLFLDSWTIMDAAQALGKVHCSQTSQSLGRVVVITCYNLLEAFMDGLVAVFLHENPDAPERIKDRLNGKEADGKYRKLEVKEKFEHFIADITGGPNLDVSQPPFRDLLGKYKWRRNAFVHPSMPHHARDKYRIDRETGFHDITLEGVRETVDMTLDAISVVWQRVHGKPQPSWLPKRESDGRFCRVNVKLLPSDPPP